MSNSDNVKTRNYSFVTYANPATLVDHFPNVIHCIAIFHNKDYKDNNIRDVPHYHCILIFKNPRIYSGVFKSTRELADSTGINTFVEPVHSLPKAVLYLLHQDEESLADPFKHSYDFSETFSDNPSWWQKVYSGSDDLFNMEFVQDLLVLSPVAMAYKYGRDFIRNFARYKDFKDFLYQSYGGDYQFLDEELKNVGASDILGFKSSSTLHYNYNTNENGEFVNA